ncbi:hypothetical protein L6250_00910 [Candidatus Parcubacteria bacterium]|nr:hypothetical protein [Patescibacteria group bacterium]MBU4467016.1 hypothetical protein [Patescibacteria group bacterium]MCG2688187.1 hypothetical protein [Candidatus Parcubacteria bacterium]
MTNNFWKKYSLNLIIGLIDLSLVIFIILFPVKIIIKDIAELSSLKKILFSLEEQEDNFNILNKNYRANFEAINKLDGTFVNSEEPIDFLTFIENSSAELGLTTKIIPTNPQKFKNDVWPSMVFRLSSKGELAKIMAFLDKLENSSYLAEVTDFSLKKPVSKEDTSNQIEAEFGLKVFAK